MRRILDVIALVLISNACRCRCFSEKLSNSTFDEIRKIYSAYEKPSCTIFNESEILYLPEADLVHQIYTFDYLRSEDDNKAPIACDKWIYKLDYGYHSMTSDVSLKNILLLHVTSHNLFLYTYRSSTGCAIRHGNQHWDNRYFLLDPSLDRCCLVCGRIGLVDCQY